MAVLSRAVSVATTATRLDSAEDTDHPDSEVWLYNDGAATVYLGGPTVTTSGATKGGPLAAGEHMAWPLKRPDVLYGICASGTVSVIVTESGV